MVCLVNTKARAAKSDYTVLKYLLKKAKFILKDILKINRIRMADEEIILYRYRN